MCPSGGGTTFSVPQAKVGCDPRCSSLRPSPHVNHGPEQSGSTMLLKKDCCELTAERMSEKDWSSMWESFAADRCTMTEDTDNVPTSRHDLLQQSQAEASSALVFVVFHALSICVSVCVWGVGSSRFRSSAVS